MSRQIVRFSTVGATNWGDRPVAIVGGGPSLQGFDFHRLQDRFRVLTVNASAFDVPFATAGFSIDRKAARYWWQRLKAEVSFPFYLAMPEPILVEFDGPPPPSMVFLRRVQGTSFTAHPGWISTGGTSGFGALHLAFLKGARQITLFGFDYRPSARGQWHHNEAHYNFRQTQALNDWAQWARNFDHVAPVLKEAGVEVINASPDSAITAFPRVSINEALA